MNRFQKQKERLPVTKRLILPLCIFIFLVILFLSGVNSISSGSREEQKKALENSILRSSVHCYAVEGRYPESLSYLEEHYGITYDHTEYMVDYEITGANLMPSVTVIPLKKEGRK